MRMRLANVPEGQLGQCIEHAVWGRKGKFSNWDQGDMLVLLVDKHIAAIAQVSGPQTISGVQVWDNGLFPNRIPIEFTHILLPNNRIPFKGKIKDSFLKTYGSQYGYVILNKQIVTNDIAQTIWTEVCSKPNSI